MAVPVAETNMVADHNVSNPAKPIKDIMGTAMTYNKSLKQLTASSQTANIQSFPYGKISLSEDNSSLVGFADRLVH